MPQYIEGTFIAPSGRFALCASRFNSSITEQLITGAIDALVRHGLKDSAIDVYRVPGAFELPGLASKICQSQRYAGLICLGAIIRGGTPHFDYLCSHVFGQLGRLAADSELPISLGILTCDTVDQAFERAGSKSGNKGYDAAMGVLEMVNLYDRLRTLSRTKT